MVLSVLASACAGSEDVAPEAVDVAGIIQQTMAAQQPGVTPEDVASAVQSAMQSQPGGVTQAEVAAAIAQALSSQPGGVTESQMASAVANAMGQQEGITEADVANAIAQALRQQKPGLTEAEVSAAIAGALADRPGVSEADIASAVASAVAEMAPAEQPVMTGPSGPITPTGIIVVAAQDIATPSGWPTFAPNWQTLTMTRVQQALQHGDIDDKGNLTYHPWLAKSWEMAEDLSYSDFQLQEGVQFHKGWGELTAEDVAWSWNAGNPVITPEAVHDSLPFPDVGRLDAIGKYVVRVNWTPFGVKGYLGTSDHGEPIGVAPKRAFDENGGEWMQENMLGSGPYEMVEWIAQRHVKVTARPDIENVWEKVPFVRDWRYLAVPESFTRVALLETNGAQIAELETKDWNALFEKGFKKIPNEGIQVYHLMWQGNYWETEQPKSGDPLERDLDTSLPWVCEMMDEGCNATARKWRQALFMAVDRQALVDSVLQGLGKVVLSPQAYQESAFLIKYGDRWGDAYDPVQAKVIFDDWATEWESKGNKVEDITIEQWTGPTGVRVEMAEAIAANWLQIFGVPSVIDKQPYATYRPSKINRTAKGMFARNCCGSTPMTWDTEQWHTALTAPGGYNAGAEYPVGSRVAIEKNNNATDEEKLEELTIEWMDFLYDNHLDTGVAQGEIGSLYNQNEIVSFLPRRGRQRSVGGVPDPEWVLPNYR